jgi:uncharacterized repeat protein (TIGR03803 family)
MNPLIRPRRWKLLRIVILFCVAAASAANAQTFTTLTKFAGENGGGSEGVLIQGLDGAFYGTTVFGALGKCTQGCGTIFKITSEGKLRMLYRFCSEENCSDGYAPYAGLVLARDGNFYGTTAQGGNSGCGFGCGNGTVFNISRDGTLTVLHAFSGADGAYPFGHLIQANDGNFYGTTLQGGDSNDGTVFRITPEGVLGVVHSFNGKDGYLPDAGLVQGSDGNFYGVTREAGNQECYPPYGCGTIFKLTPHGRLTTLYKFCDQPNCSDGAFPYAKLAQAADGAFYGTTIFGGDDSVGTIFRITSEGIFTRLHSFDVTDGGYPYSGLVQGTDGSLYGTTFGGGRDQCACGTVFRITLAGGLTVLHNFTGMDGASPFSGLVQATNGLFYGTTFDGGDFTCGAPDGCGTVFSLDMGLSPFVAFVRDMGKVGSTGGIIGQGFTGTTSVSLNGIPADFTLVSDTFLKATVPAGATTGFVTVTTPSGTLTSDKPFRVTPQFLSFDPPSGPVGAQVSITGVSLTQTQGVGFGDRVPAQFTVSSDTQVTATVPPGAKTGKVGIETKGGIAISVGTFTVTP